MEVDYIFCLTILRNVGKYRLGRGAPLFFLIAFLPPSAQIPLLCRIDLSYCLAMSFMKQKKLSCNPQKSSCCNHFCLSFFDQEKDVRIIISLMYESKCRKLMCSVRKWFFSSLINFWFQYECIVNCILMKSPRKSCLFSPHSSLWLPTFSSPVTSDSLSHQPPEPWRVKNQPARRLRGYRRQRMGWLTIMSSQITLK